MAEIKSILNDIDAKFTLVLTEDEARALDAITGYGPEKFLEWFERNMGKHYIRNAKGGLKSLFTTVRAELPGQLSKINEARKLLNLPSKQH